VFNATFTNILVISWQSVLLVEETEYPEKTTNLSKVIDKLYHMMNILFGLFLYGAIVSKFCDSLNNISRDK
jgi:hypothetical protein